MPSTPRLLAFCLTASVLIAVPGPSVLFTVTRSLTLGRLAGVATVVGNAFGVYVQAAAVAVGVGYLVERSVLIFTVVKLAGAAYLVYLGVQTIRHRKRLPALLQTRIERKSVARLVFDGFLVGVANPKAVVFFTAVLPQFVDRQAGDATVQLLILGGVFFGIALLSDTAWALAAGTARAWFTSSARRLERVGAAGGLVMIGIGVTLARTGRSD